MRGTVAKRLRKRAREAGLGKTGYRRLKQIYKSKGKH
jgi:hypothetical protein